MECGKGVSDVFAFTFAIQVSGNIVGKPSIVSIVIRVFYMK